MVRNFEQGLQLQSHAHILHSGAAEGEIERLSGSNDQALCGNATCFASGSGGSLSGSPTFQVHTSYSPVCRQWCSCCCHRKRVFRGPSALEIAVGSFFVGYTGSLVRRQPCDDNKCLRRTNQSIRITYCFPSWCVCRAVTLSISGPKISLTALRIVPTNSPVMVYCREDACADHLARLLNQGLASPMDVDPEGWTPLHVCRTTGNTYPFLSPNQY